MLKSFKYLELTRHHIYVKAKKMIKDSTEKEASAFEKQTEVIFSSALSLFLTYLAETYFAKPIDGPLKILDILGLFASAIVLYFVFYYLVRKIYLFVQKKWNTFSYKKQTHSPELTEQKNKELIDDFDHIAFDNLIIAYEFLEQISLSNRNEVRTFYFHEILYYLRTSVNKTLEITHPDRREDCLNIFNNTNGIDVFRLVNAHKMMCEVHAELLLISEGTGIQMYDEELTHVLKTQINDIGNDIDEIGVRCETAQNDIKHKI